MLDVTDIKDLGSSKIGGVECDFLAFRKKDVDFQIWIAQGAQPYPCRYMITSRVVAGGPQYSIQVKDWKAGNDVATGDFSFKNPSNAKQADLQDLRDRISDLPYHSVPVGGAK